MMKRYRLLRDLPWAVKETVYIGCGDKGLYYKEYLVYNGKPCSDADGLPAELIINYPKWFEEVIERWKPKMGESYWIVYIKSLNTHLDIHTWHTWVNDGIDIGHWKNGNCFKTKEQAKEANQKVKTLLLSLCPKS